MKSVAHTPEDYTERVYRVYFEVMDVDGKAESIIASYSQELPLKKAFGYEANVAMQMIPEIVRRIAAENIAVYQIVRLQK